MEGYFQGIVVYLEYSYSTSRDVDAGIGAWSACSSYRYIYIEYPNSPIYYILLLLGTILSPPGSWVYSSIPTRYQYYRGIYRGLLVRIV